MQNTAKRYVISQFANPRGPVGLLAGLIMVRRPSNQRRNLWTLELMEVAAGDRIWEIGYGPGFALQNLLKRNSKIRVVGIDRSKTMHWMAKLLNHVAVKSGRAKLLVGSIEELEKKSAVPLDGPFSKIYSINTAMFWRKPVETFSLLRSRLSPDGKIYITYQPRIGGKTDAAALASAAKIKDQMLAARYSDVRLELCKELSPVAVCLIGSV